MAAMRQNKKSAGTVDPAARQKKKKLVRGIILLTVLIFLIVGCAAALFWLNNRMFKENKHFILRRANIVSNGYWGKGSHTTDRLLRKLNLHINESNLFAIQPGQLRSELRSIPNIADAQVKVILPDTLEINIEERIPRAFIGRPNSPLVTDANCVIMNSKECFGVHPNLPVINGTVHHSMRAGEVHNALRPALHLIMAVQRYRCFSVAAVSLSQTDNLLMFIDYRNGSVRRRYHVTMPRGNYPQWLDILQSAIEDARRHGDDRNRIDLTNKGQVVMSK
ncbi:MAG: FtsQ-type POTRA domain-containing protein [Lentisphaeria bacterium]|nr:FtsQ-type POTRA domain-containing protein [Lentisphaeria bacterium]